MKYPIIDNPSYTNNTKIGIEIAPDNEILRFFFALIKVGDYPKGLANKNQWSDSSESGRD